MGKNYHWHTDAIGFVVVSTRHTEHDRGQQGCAQGLEGLSDTDGGSNPVHCLFDPHALGKLTVLQSN